MISSLPIFNISGHSVYTYDCEEISVLHLFQIFLIVSCLPCIYLVNFLVPFFSVLATTSVCSYYFGADIFTSWCWYSNTSIHYLILIFLSSNVNTNSSSVFLVTRFSRHAFTTFLITLTIFCIHLVDYKFSSTIHFYIQNFLQITCSFYVT